MEAAKVHVQLEPRTNKNNEDDTRAERRLTIILYLAGGLISIPF